jgi:hypothetical protein
MLPISWGFPEGFSGDWFKILNPVVRRVNGLNFQPFFSAVIPNGFKGVNRESGEPERGFGREFAGPLKSQGKNKKTAFSK